MLGESATLAGRRTCRWRTNDAAWLEIDRPIAFSTGSFGVRNAQRNVGLLHLFGLDLRYDGESLSFSIDDFVVEVAHSRT